MTSVPVEKEKEDELQKAKKTIKRLRVRCSKLRSTVHRLAEKSKRGVSKESTLKLLKKHINGKAYQFVATQIRLAGKSEVCLFSYIIL